jgi:hypothetical protein
MRRNWCGKTRFGRHKNAGQITSDVVKAKINELEKSLTNQIPFQVSYPIGESTGVKRFPFKSRVYLVKTNENKIIMRMEAGGNASDDSYTNADPDILIMITDDKLNSFLNAIQEELKKRLSKWLLIFNLWKKKKLPDGKHMKQPKSSIVVPNHQLNLKWCVVTNHRQTLQYSLKSSQNINRQSSLAS